MNKLAFIIHLINTFNKTSGWFGILCLLIFSNTVFAEVSRVKPLEVSQPNKLAEKYFLQGDFENAIIQWTSLAQEYAERHDIDQQRVTLIKLANAYHALGQYSASIETLDRANKLADTPQQKLIIMNGLGASYLAIGKLSKADDLLQKSIGLARKNIDTDLLVALLNNLGNLKTKKGEFNQALKVYSEGIGLAQTSGNNQLAAKSSVNAVLAASKTANKEVVSDKLVTAKIYLEKIADDHNKAFSWISLGQIAQGLFNNKQPDKTDWQSYAYHAFKQAERIGEKISDARAISYAKGHLGKLYFESDRLEEALQLTRQAIFSIEKSQSPEILYQWQWQTGRILKAKGDNRSAILAYQQAVSTLHSIRQDLSAQQTHTGSFREDIVPVYMELADLLLQTNDTLEKGEKYQQNLVAARNVIEQLKAAELQDYFKDDCVSSLQEKIKSLDSIDSQSTVVYPILLADRVEILLSLPDGLERFTVSTNREAMINEVRLFRQTLENRTTREYLPHAQKLYQWLITPLQVALSKHKINTLVMVPDEFLRTIPMAALHDGKKFLIEKYAIANTPGLNITDSKPITKDNAQVLAIGLTESVQGFPALPYVTTEIANINQIFGGKSLQDKDFLINKVQNELKQTPYNIVHIASHGQFKTKVSGFIFPQI